MRLTLLKTVTLLALAAFSTLALADPPARVGRIAVAQGDVSLRNGDGDEAGAALLNWPVTSESLIRTERNATAEFRVGSTAVRLGADSELEVSELDDDSFKLRLHYGSVAVRARNADMLSGFELTTAQARVLLQQPGWVRVDADRRPDTSVVSVLAGEARVDGGGASLVVRTGKRADVRDDDVSTGALVRDRFDDWPEAPDSGSASLRYLTDDTTGYEELDRYGSWRENAEYGPLWLPRSLPVDWAPYRDGRWTWLDPWGWTWIDNAPWGYAPSHYGNWVLVNQRWAWTPGPRRVRHVWAPAMVGWVGGNNWQANFNHAGKPRPAPAVGWFPLSPRERFVPGYRASPEYERRLNAGRDGKGGQPGRRDGLTVLPHEQFGSRHTVSVDKAPRARLAPGEFGRLPAGTAPQLGRNQARTNDTRRDPADQTRPWPGRDGQWRSGQAGVITTDPAPARDPRAPGGTRNPDNRALQERTERERTERERTERDRSERERAVLDKSQWERMQNERAERENLSRERAVREQPGRDWRQPSGQATNPAAITTEPQNRPERQRREIPAGGQSGGARPAPQVSQPAVQPAAPRVVVPPSPVQVQVPSPAARQAPNQGNNDKAEARRREIDSDLQRRQNER